MNFFKKIDLNFIFKKFWRESQIGAKFEFVCFEKIHRFVIAGREEMSLSCAIDKLIESLIENDGADYSRLPAAE